MKSIGIVGCGAIGQAICHAVESGTLKASIAGVTSRTRETAEAFLGTLKAPPPYLDLDDLVQASDLLVEACGQAMVPELARKAFAAGKGLLVISIGALLDHPDIIEQARARNCPLILPSGAIAALDGVKSACVGAIEHVTITTRKPPGGLEGSPFLLERKMTLQGLKEELELYHGPVREAVRGFPANVNVAAAVSLAGIGPDQTQIRIVAVPGLERNCHTVDVQGEFGQLTMSIQNVPSENPKTGKLTAFSIVRSLQDAMDPVRIGT